MRKINAETPKPPTSIRLLTFCLSQYFALMKVVTNQKFWYLVAHTSFGVGDLVSWTGAPSALVLAKIRPLAAYR